MTKPENAQDAQELADEAFFSAYGITRQVYGELSPEEQARLTAELQLEEQATMFEENPQRLGMTQAEGEANAALLRREADDLRRTRIPVRRPELVVRRPRVRRARTRVRRTVRRRARAPGRPRSADDPAEHVARPVAA